MAELLEKPALPHLHWREYSIEAFLLGCFMVSASVFGVLLFHPASPVVGLIPTELIRRTLMGLAMGSTAVVLIYSPLGMRSGAHMNPATTLTFWRLGKVRGPDVVGYLAAQFVGGAAGMAGATLILHRWIAHPTVHHVSTIPGRLTGSGLVFAWLAEAVISGVLMLLVLISSNHGRLHRWTGVVAGCLVMVWIIVESPVSGMSMNPARSLASAVVDGLGGPAGQTLWIYFTAPVAGMLAASATYQLSGRHRQVYCAKLHHSHRGPCIFACRFDHLAGSRTDLAETLTRIQTS